MEGFTIIDGVVALVIVISALLAYGRGFVRELMAIVGWIAATVLAYLFAPQVEPLVRELPVVGEFLADSCELSIIGAFTLVLAITLVIVSLFTPLFSSLVQRSIFGGFDQALGFIFGVARGILLVAIAFFVYSTVITGQQFTIVDDSRSSAVFGSYAEDIQNSDPDQALGWITGKYEELVSSCSAS
ncbi:CvpA family protein [Sulfitobacter albidus]|uniref:CvpA family protein n=1 Tax=Sulfitobacter albidus TaxID=2829501 RepID=A0A975JH57_9RHOB|nr:CvpA family protein [Sulfitobacter albidus]QUJ77880.1 CvpA family protein [Sulfitobacter albidus]